MDLGEDAVEALLGITVDEGPLATFTPMIGVINRSPGGLR
jgi:hypothetical protein